MFRLKPYGVHMPDEIDRWGEETLYMQLAEILRGQIERGDLAPGQQLPSESALVQQYGLARNTVRQALAVLRSEGLIITRGQRGSRVRPRER